MQHYETIFILTPVLTEEQVKTAIKKYVDFLKKNKANIVHEESWGLRKLAYPIQKKDNGYYYIIEFKSESSFINTLETEFKRDTNILRYLTVKLNEHGVAYNEKRRAEMKSKKPTEKEKKEKVNQEA